MMITPCDLRITSYLPQSGHGAGGMTVGLTTSGMIVHHIPTGIGISCDSERSQWANKEKAIQMLGALLLAIESEKHFDTGPQDIGVMPQHDKVRMIKEVRRKAGSGLKEAKEAVDKYWGCPDCEALAISHLLTDLTERTVGYCDLAGGCVCGGDLPAIREGCYNWQS